VETAIPAKKVLLKMGVQIVRHARQIVFHLVEVAVPRDLFPAVLK